MSGDLLELTPESFDRTVGVNLRGTFFLSQAVARAMIAAGGVPLERWGARRRMWRTR